MEEKGGYFMLQSKKKIYGLLCLACVVFFSLFLLLFHTAGGFSSSNQVPILMYHHLAPAGTYSGTGDADNGAIITPEAFAQQMAYLAASRIHISFSQRIGRAATKRRGITRKGSSYHF